LSYLPDQCCHACRARALPGADHCAQHPPKAENAKEYDRNPNRTSRFYYTSAWAQCSQNIRVHNPICAKVDENGKQCQRKSALVHHIRDPRDAPELKLSWGNLVPLCQECHDGGARGSIAGERYVHTLGPFGAVFKHVGHDGGFPQWKTTPENAAETTTPEPARYPLPCEGRTTAVGDDELDRALAAED
jgi:hypothetical protein